MRSAYEVKMLFDLAGVGQKVRWYVADDLQPWAPDGNQFVSTNWINRDRTAGELGEQPGPMTWKNGKDFRIYPTFTSDGCGMDTLLENGFSPGGQVGPWTDGKLDCCTSPMIPSCCGGSDVPASLSLTISDTGGACSCLAGTYALTWDPAFTAGFAFQPGAWTCPVTVCSGTVCTLCLFCNPTVPGYVLGIPDAPGGSFGALYSPPCPPPWSSIMLDLTFAGLPGCIGTSTWQVT
jgi:hypothetical protein